MSGWRGLSGECHATQVEAANALCAGFSYMSNGSTYTRCASVDAVASGPAGVQITLRMRDLKTETTTTVVNTSAEIFPCELTSGPFDLSVEDGATVAIAVVGTWTVAWCFRALYSVLRDGGEVHEN